MIDITFDVRTDANGGDPDAKSKTLKQYHRLLWSKELPNDKSLKLNEKLQNTTDSCEYNFGSDSISHSFSRWKKYKHIIDLIDPKEIEEFVGKGSTIGGYIIFSSNRINNAPTINGARGLNSKISDRFDLTLECIRRYYLSEEIPLSFTIKNEVLPYALKNKLIY